MTRDKDFSRPKIFIGLALVDSKKKERRTDIAPCLLHIPTRTLYLMSSSHDVVSAVKQLCSRHQLQPIVDYVAEDMSINEVVGSCHLELLEEADELCFSEADSYEELFEHLLENLISRSRSEAEDLFDEHILNESRFDFSDAESEFLEKVLVKMQNQQKTTAIRKIFELYLTDAGDVTGQKTGLDLVANYLDSSEIQETLCQADSAFQNPIFGEEDITYSLEDIPFELVEKYQLKEGPAVKAQINVMITEIDEFFHPKKVVRQGSVNPGCHDDALNFEKCSFMQCPSKSEQEIVGELTKEAMKAEVQS